MDKYIFNLQEILLKSNVLYFTKFTNHNQFVN